jgi:hypothetical protein
MELSRRSTAAVFCEAFAKYFASGCRAIQQAKSTVARVLRQNWRPARRKCRQQRTAASRVTFAANWLLCARFKFALVAQLDRASDFESEGREFESLRARHEINDLAHYDRSSLAIKWHRAVSRLTTPEQAATSHSGARGTRSFLVVPIPPAPELENRMLKPRRSRRVGLPPGDVTDLIAAIMRKLTMPAGCIDVTREMCDGGTVISLIGDNVWRAFPAQATRSKAQRPTTSNALGNGATGRHGDRKKP